MASTRIIGGESRLDTVNTPYRIARVLEPSLALLEVWKFCAEENAMNTRQNEEDNRIVARKGPEPLPISGGSRSVAATSSSSQVISGVGCSEVKQ